jgi:hypothetical protein
MPLLERLMIALLAVLVVALLIGAIKFDMARTAASSLPLPAAFRY